MVWFFHKRQKISVAKRAWSPKEWVKKPKKTLHKISNFKRILVIFLKIVSQKLIQILPFFFPLPSAGNKIWLKLFHCINCGSTLLLITFHILSCREMETQSQNTQQAQFKATSGECLFYKLFLLLIKQVKVKPEASRISGMCWWVLGKGNKTAFVTLSKCKIVRDCQDNWSCKRK